MLLQMVFKFFVGFTKVFYGFEEKSTQIQQIIRVIGGHKECDVFFVKTKNGNPENSNSCLEVKNLSFRSSKD